MGGRGSILVVDPDETTRDAVRALADRLRYSVLIVDDAEGLAARLDDRPVLGIIEVELPGATSGLEVLCDLHNAYGADLPILLVSAGRIMPHERAVGLLLGADDYIIKPFDPGEFHARVRRSLRGAATSRSNPATPASEFALSTREQEILALLAGGRSQQEIAATLFISPKTVATHIQHLLTKLSVHSRAQAVALAFRHGLVPSDTNREAVAR
jgi:DNA-binding NarL/FixJ family response regulator